MDFEITRENGEGMRFIIDLVPVTKKNHQQILINRKTGRPFIMPSSQYKQYERNALQYIHPLPKAPIRRPCNVRGWFFMPTRRRVDLVNLQEALLDILVLAGVLGDDNASIVAAMDGSRVLYDKQRPRTEVLIRMLEPVEM